MQYTIRNIRDPLDAALRRSARERGKNLSDIARTWDKHPAFDRALAEPHAIDAELWR